MPKKAAHPLHIKITLEVINYQHCDSASDLSLAVYGKLWIITENLITDESKLAV